MFFDFPRDGCGTSLPASGAPSIVFFGIAKDGQELLENERVACLEVEKHISV